jgi:hypothetical protein
VFEPVDRIFVNRQHLSFLQRNGTGAMSSVQRPHGTTTLVTVPPVTDESSGQMIRIAAPNTSKFYWLKAFLFTVFTSISVGVAIKWMSFGAQERIHPSDYGTRTAKLLATTPLIDGHNDLPFLLRLQLQNQIYNDNFPFGQSKTSSSRFLLTTLNADPISSPCTQGLTSHTDLKRMKEGKVGGQFWSIFIEVRESDKPRRFGAD